MPFALRIQFDNPHATYYAGQYVTGRVFVNTDKPKKFRAITINFKGAAEVRWSESESRRDSEGKQYEHTEHYTAEETYFENKHNLVGSGSGEHEIPAGEHSYPFQCQIPHTAPSSFEGEHGHIRYIVRAVMDRPWKFDIDCKAAFTVVAPLDLNTLPQAKEPIQFEESKHFCCLWCRSGPLTLTVELPVGGFVPGQTIPLHIDIENGSNIKIHPINCVLRKEISWHARNPLHKTQVTKTVLDNIAVDDEVKPHDSKSFSKDITVPSLPPSNLTNCGIIDLEYVLKVEAVASGCHNNLSARLPILIGTIPLLTGPTAYKPGPAAVQPVGPMSNPAYPPQSNGSPAPGLVQPSTNPSYPVYPGAQPSPASEPGLGPVPNPPVGGGWNIPLPASPDAPAPQGPATAPSAPPLYPELPPPSYEESIFKGNTIRDSKDNEHTMGIEDFTPRYPVWTFGPVNPPNK